MTRIIKFRAWNDEHHMMSKPFELSVALAGHTSQADFTGSVVMQFTGLHDKNGKEIYEGDLLLHPKWQTQTVINRHGCFGLDVVGVGRFTDGFNAFCNVDTDYENCEVIGNIWENPDLLKEAA